MLDWVSDEFLLEYFIGEVNMKDNPDGVLTVGVTFSEMLKKIQKEWQL